MSDIYLLMKNRRSIRKYRQEPVSDDKLQRIVTAGGLAPSGANRQPWLHVLVDDSALKRDIRRLSEEADARWNAERNETFRKWLKNQDIAESSKPFLEEAPFLLCVFANSNQPYWLESAWISIGYMLLAIEEEGLGTLTYTPGYPGFLNELLKVPELYVPQAILPLGYPAEAPDGESRKRKPPGAFVFRNSYAR